MLPTCQERYIPDVPFFGLGFNPALNFHLEKISAHQFGMIPAFQITSRSIPLLTRITSLEGKQR